MSLETGDQIPDLELAVSGGGTLKLGELSGHKRVIYFYPKDNTSGCTMEGQDFAARHQDFLAAGCEVYGVSRDSIRSHDNFIAKFGFPFKLLSDPDEVACQAFGVIVEKNMYGRKYMGVNRSTFLFDTSGKCVGVWRSVKVKGHVDAVLEAAQAA